MKIFLFVLLATAFETAGDAVLRIALHSSAWHLRVAYFALGMLLLTLYGTSLNLAPVEFANVVGLYIALLFVTFQITNFLFFQVKPTLPIFVGGALIVAGGLLVMLWQPQNVSHNAQAMAIRSAQD